MRRYFVLLLVGVSISLSLAGKAIACKGSQVLFEDNFSTLDPGWGHASENLSVSDGKLIMKPAENAGVSAINQANIFDDVDACVTVTMAKSDDPTTSSSGLVFWVKDFGDYYYLYTMNGAFTVARWVGGRWLYPVSATENAAIKKGVGEANNLRVVTNGNEAKIYINDTEMIPNLLLLKASRPRVAD